VRRTTSQRAAEKEGERVERRERISSEEEEGGEGGGANSSTIVLNPIYEKKKATLSREKKGVVAEGREGTSHSGEGSGGWQCSDSNWRQCDFAELGLIVCEERAIEKKRKIRSRPWGKGKEI